MNEAQKLLRDFLNTTNKTKVETLYYPAFNPWGGNREYFQRHGVDPLWDMVVDPTRYPFDSGFAWGTWKVIRAAGMTEYMNLLNAALSEE